MAKKPPASDLVDWTLSQAPDPGEPAPNSAGDQAAPQFLGARPLERPAGQRSLSSRAVVRTGLILTALAALGFLAFKVSAAWDTYRLQRGVSEAVVLEEQSTQLGDQEKLAQLYPQAGGGWVAGQLARAQRGQPAPLPMTSLWPTSDPAVVQSVTVVTADTARADVVRHFYALDGARASFTLPQYYQFTNGQWRRIAPPASGQAEVRQWDGRFIRLSYYAVDEAVLADMGPYLDEKLAAICAAWECPAGLKFDLPFLLDDVTVTRGFDYFSPAPSAPMIFGLLLSEREAFWSSRTLPLAAPHLAGYPADAASRDIFRRLLALEVLVRLVAGLTPPSFQFSALPYALAARLSVTLDLDDPDIRSINFARAAFNSQELWALQYVSTARPLGPFYTKVAQYQALAALNNVLAGEPAGIETRLLSGLQTAPSPEAWLGQALGIPAEAAAARLEAGLANLQNVPAAAAIPSGQALTLSCRSGLASLSLDQSQARYFLSGSFADAQPIAWSPDSKRLLIEISGQLAVIEAGSGKLTWLPATADYFNQIEWVSDSVLAYTLWPRDLFRVAFEPGQFGLHYFDTADPQRSLPAIPGVQQFVLSPDRSQAVLVLVNAQPSFERQASLALIPALGGPLRRLADAALSPDWSPDGRTILFAQVNTATVSLHTLDLATGAAQRIFDTGTWDRTGQPADLSARWSPAGDRVMLAVQGGYGTHFNVWSLRPDGSEPVMVYDGPAAAYADPVRFSADGAYLSVTLWDPYWRRQTAIYNAATGAKGLRLANAGGWAAWAPTGHELVMSSYEGISLITNPGDPLGQPR
ncbi:MAG: hypothetical protein ABI847_08325, partial [Anaerolineales bacterium]